MPGWTDELGQDRTTGQQYERGPYHAENIEMLRKLRKHCNDLDAAANSAEAIHFGSAQMLRDRTELLALSICYVPVDCYICGDTKDVPVRVGDTSEPNLVICGKCGT